MKPKIAMRAAASGGVERPIAVIRGRRARAAHHVLGRGEAAVDVLGGERLHQATERKIGHGEARGAARNEETGNVEVVHPHRNRETGCAMREMEVDQGEFGMMRFGGGHRAVEVLGSRDDAIARIVLDEIFQRRRQLAIILNDQDLEIFASPGKTMFGKDILRQPRPTANPSPSWLTTGRGPSATRRGRNDQILPPVVRGRTET